MKKITKPKQVSKFDYRVVLFITLFSLLIFIVSSITLIGLLFIPSANSGSLAYFVPILIVFGIFGFLFFMFLSWLLYLKCYKKILVTKLGDKNAFSWIVFLKVTYFISFWLAFGWIWIWKYSYKREFGLSGKK